jgi:hypothetical protein
MRVVRLKDQQLRRAEVLTSYGEALEKMAAEKEREVLKAARSAA